MLYLPEEYAFWMLCSVAEDLLPEYYNKALLGSQVDLSTFSSLGIEKAACVHREVACNQISFL